MGKQEEGGTGLKHLIFRRCVPHPSYIDRPLVSKAIQVLISTSKYASQHWAGDTCVDI